MKQSETYRQNAKNCAYLAKVPPMSQRGSGTSEWKRPGEHWPTNRIGLMESRRLYVRATANPAQQGNAFASRRQRCRCFGTTVSIKSFTLRATGTAHQWSGTAPALTHVPRGRGAVLHPALVIPPFYKGDDSQRQSRCYIAGSNTPLCRALYATIGSGPRPSPGPRYPGMAARGTW